VTSPLSKVESVPDPSPQVIPEPTPDSSPSAVPETIPVASPPRPVRDLSGLDSLIDAAPEISEIPAAPPTDQPPWKSEKPVVTSAPVELPPDSPSLTDAFHNDPLIQAALVKFEGKFIA
jgi:hypothetical protein